MANSEHVAKLKEGVQAWNAWRAQNPDIRLDLSEVDLRGAELGRVNLFGANLYQTDLRGTKLNGADLRGAYLREADLDGANLCRADLRWTDLEKANLNKADLGGAELGEAYLHEAHLFEADFSEANLSGADLGRAYLDEAKLIGANLEETNLEEAFLGGTNLSGANLAEAKLFGTSFIGANLEGVNLGGMNLVGVYFGEANLREVNFEGADLEGANFDRANLGGANLREADLDGANLCGANLRRTDLTNAKLQETIFTNTDLTNAKGLESCVHRGPSSIDHRTLARSGELPLSFLRGCGLPDTFIDYLPSLLNQPIQHYSCFISYSNKDETFAKRLHADLQGNGVRCWFALEDMKIGDKILDTIDEAIRLRDKVLLILSKHSIISEWVEDEVTKAYSEERQRRHKQTILFPIRLDEAVMETGEPWAVKLRDGRHIGDFCNWKSHDEYQQGLERLLRDLQIEKTDKS